MKALGLSHRRRIQIADRDLFCLWKIRFFSQDPDLNQNDLPDKWEEAKVVTKPNLGVDHTARVAFCSLGN